MADVIGEGWLLKVAIVPGAVLLTTEILPKVLNAGTQAIIIAAAVVGAAGVLGKLVRRAWRNSKDFVSHIRRGLDVIESTPERFEKLEATLKEHGKTLEHHAASFEVMADADKRRIKDALAGDERSPVDRRSAA